MRLSAHSPAEACSRSHQRPNVSAHEKASDRSRIYIRQQPAKHQEHHSEDNVGQEGVPVLSLLGFLHLLTDYRINKIGEFWFFIDPLAQLLETVNVAIERRNRRRQRSCTCDG